VLPSRYGIGDLGLAAAGWVDLLHEAGQGWWQALALGPTGYGNSPYRSLSSFAGNEQLISPDRLIEDGLLRGSDCISESFSSPAIDYAAVIPFKRRRLEQAWSNFRTGAPGGLQANYGQFCNTHRHWPEDYALFRALKLRHNGAYYLEWPTELVRRVPAALAMSEPAGSPQQRLQPRP
jgi:4-alpha-glucanotransferase